MKLPAPRWRSDLHRELVLLSVLAAVTVAAFFGTRAVAQSNEALRLRQAAAWFDRAERASKAGDAVGAVASLRLAVAKEPENREYRLALAGALAANRLDDEARRVLLALRETQPEDPEANLLLAQIESRGPDALAARRYYQSALAGLWRPEQADRRREVRIALINFLLAHDERARALAELLVLTPNLPEDATLEARVGRMFLEAGDDRLALDHFLRAIQLNPGNADAHAGAGQAAFDLGEYRRALRHLDAVAPHDSRIATLREVARLVLDADPLAPRLRSAERRRRLSLALDQAARRLATCSIDPGRGSGSDLEPFRREAEAFQAALKPPVRRELAELVDEGVDLVYRIERTVEHGCATPPAPYDRALLLIGRRHGIDQS